MKTLVLTSADIETLVRTVGADGLMDQLIVRLGHALRVEDDGAHRTPVRSGFAYHHPVTGLLEWMPSMHQGRSVTLKMVGYHPRNPEDHGLPTILSTLCRFDPGTGHLAGLVDGTFLTALRTGAASALATDVLSDPGARVLGLIGCGAQAVTQVHALTRVRSFDAIRYYDVRPEVAATLAGRLSFLGGGIRLAPGDPGEILEVSDVLCTQTSVGVGEGPVVPDGSHRAELHINAVGSDFPGKTEIPVSLLRRAVVFPDFVEQALKEGECQNLTRDELGPDLRALLRCGECERVAWRSGLTVFDSTGWALEDEVVMDLVLERAADLGLGREVSIECGRDPLDPYAFLRGGAESGGGSRLRAGWMRDA